MQVFSLFSCYSRTGIRNYVYGSFDASLAGWSGVHSANPVASAVQGRLHMPLLLLALLVLLLVNVALCHGLSWWGSRGEEGRGGCMACVRPGDEWAERAERAGRVVLFIGVVICLKQRGKANTNLVRTWLVLCEPRTTSESRMLQLNYVKLKMLRLARHSSQGK